MKRQLCTCLLALAALLLAPSVLTAQGGFVVIVHSDNPIDSIDRETLSRMFMGRIGKWESGLRVAPIDLESESETRGAFTSAVHKRKVFAVVNYWQTQLFSGKSSPPPEERDPAKIVAWVSSTPGAVGYVPSDAELGPLVKVLEVRGI